MRKKHHTLSVAAIVIALAVCIGSVSEAGMFRTSYPKTAIRVLKPGARISSGEPDTGGGRSQNSGGGVGFVPSPNGFGFIVPVWVTRFVGAGW